APRDEILAFADELLDVGSFPEYGPAGGQVLGGAEVTKVVCGVSSSRELFVRAAAAGAQLVLVHHGLFWRNEPLVVDARMRGRLEALFAADITLAAYHLPLDAHPELGNNAQLARRLGVEPERPFGGVGLGGRVPQPVAVAELVERVRAVLEREPLVFADGPESVVRVAISSGGAGHDLVAAAHEGYDLFLTGEAEEPSMHAARELGIHLVAGGHYATERFGVQALAERLAERFDLEWEFVELPNPV
ncbi:MAG TPA: Nif3-like dinuclear metal center hexameric protein, partial [Gaiellaceae bacterium]|nr:Nif3-like dinuclear metal center hexameric protein [Gaiellaceae bacterium]